MKATRRSWLARHGRRALPLALIAIALAVLLGVSLHSLEEIHYLKSFFPRRFTVEQAYYAALIELVKVIIVALPLVVAIAVCLRLAGGNGGRGPPSRD